MQGSKILLGVTGGIAAYKAALVLRELVRQGAQVRVVMTAAAQRFITPETLAVLSKNKVHTDLFENTDEFPVLHVGLGQWADLILLAPATANIIAKMANGLGDDLLSTLLLGRLAPVLVAPAMEEGMLKNPMVQANMEKLKDLGYFWVDPEVGELASGAHGQGRLAAPQTIVERAIQCLNQQSDLQGMRLLITAGPTVEDIDPVRFISNRSSGKMGYALAERALARGAQVCLITGPTALEPPAAAECIRVRSTLEMQSAVDQVFERVDAAILASAVADYRAAQVAPQKIKRGGNAITLSLVENPDISAALGARKKARVVVAFAMETEQGEQRALAKLRRKQADLIVLNNLTDEGAGFAVDTNIVTMIDPQGKIEKLPKMSKQAVGDRILDRVRAYVRLKLDG
jgi:phosphopantothenoylcysteine decarboxylase/phosphopantothenate--cysteine ligase